MIKFSDVTKKFGQVVALDKVNFEIKPEEFVFLIGPTAAGKTTLFKLLLGEYSPTTGSVQVGKLKVEELKNWQLPFLRRKIGVVFQDLKLLPDRTVFENVCLPLKILGTRGRELRKEVKNALDLVGLIERANFFPAQLSGGELQRTCIARAIVSKPKILLADEPTGNLDPATAWQIVKLLKEVNKLGKTVIMATHNFEVVNSLEERVIEMDQGKIISDKKKGKYKVK